MMSININQPLSNASPYSKINNESDMAGLSPNNQYFAFQPLSHYDYNQTTFDRFPCFDGIINTLITLAGKSYWICGSEIYNTKVPLLTGNQKEVSIV